MGHPDQMLPASQFELSPVLSSIVHTNSPGSTVAKDFYHVVFSEI